ncbi:MAG: hypothetical protein K2X74_08725, partial [Acetobacteraceae bacterium]|nr:hypothetical protein [Acetobacteraceae bacterium]
ACRAGAADLHAGTSWEHGELLALCDAVGLRRCAAARLGAFVVVLLRDAAAPPALARMGCACLSAQEVALAATLAGPPAAERAARRVVAGWWPARRRLQGLTLLTLAAGDLSDWAVRVR